MQFKIENPDKEVLNIEAKLIQLPGTDGSFAVLENHAPLIMPYIFHMLSDIL